MKTSRVPSRSTIRRSAIHAGKAAAKSAFLNIRNLLVPIDFSAASLEAVEEALPLLRLFGADLHLVHVSEPDYPLVNMAAIPLILPESEIRCRVQRRLQRVAHKYSIQLRRENIHVLRGRPFEEICHLARERSIDLIVMSTRGNAGLKRLALGSTAEHVVRYSPCPVLVMHPVDGRKANGSRRIANSTLRFDRILVPIDFSDCSMKGLAYAKALAKRFGSKLILLNSIALQYYITSDEYARYDLPLLMKRTEQSARDQVRKLVEKTNWTGIEVETAFEIGHAGQQICDRAEDRKADLIVTSTHGRTGLKHVLIGSTAEYALCAMRPAQCWLFQLASVQRSSNQDRL